jgi:hypothetical protein
VAEDYSARMEEEIAGKSEEEKKKYGEKPAFHLLNGEHEQRSKKDCCGNENVGITVPDEEKAYNEKNIEEDFKPV